MYFALTLPMPETMSPLSLVESTTIPHEARFSAPEADMVRAPDAYGFSAYKHWSGNAAARTAWGAKPKIATTARRTRLAGDCRFRVLDTTYVSGRTGSRVRFVTDSEVDCGRERSRANNKLISRIEPSTDDDVGVGYVGSSGLAANKRQT
jgi:hypothetical protein